MTSDNEIIEAVARAIEHHVENYNTRPLEIARAVARSAVEVATPLITEKVLRDAHHYAMGIGGAPGWLVIRDFAKSRGITLDGDEPPDVDCYTLPNGDCIAPNCRLHSPKDEKQ